MLQAYRAHVAERAALGIPALLPEVQNSTAPRADYPCAARARWQSNQSPAPAPAPSARRPSGGSTWWR